MGSAVALALFQAGYRVLLQDRVRPAHARRAVSFTDALFERRAMLDGVAAKRARDLDDVARMLDCGRAAPVSDHALPELLAAVRPEVLVDVRMRKRLRPEPQIALAPLTIGLGPQFVAREKVDVAIETADGPRLGRIIQCGRARDFEGEPSELGGMVARHGGVTKAKKPGARPGSCRITTSGRRQAGT